MKWKKQSDGQTLGRMEPGRLAAMVVGRKMLTGCRNKSGEVPSDVDGEKRLEYVLMR